jgi:hypothetical protein
MDFDIKEKGNMMKNFECFKDSMGWENDKNQDKHDYDTRFNEPDTDKYYDDKGNSGTGWGTTGTKPPKPPPPPASGGTTYGGSTYDPAKTN